MKITMFDHRLSHAMLQLYKCINIISKADFYFANLNLLRYTFITIKLVRKYYEFLLGEMNGCHM